MRIHGIAEDEQLGIVSSGRRTLRNVICGICGQRELVEETFDRSGDGKEGVEINRRLLRPLGRLLSGHGVYDGDSNDSL